MAAYSRTIWGRRFPQVNTASPGSGMVLTGDSIGSTASTEARIFSQRNVAARRAIYPMCYGTSATITTGNTVGARIVHKSKFSTITVFGV